MSFVNFFAWVFKHHNFLSAGFIDHLAAGIYKVCTLNPVMSISLWQTAKTWSQHGVFMLEKYIFETTVLKVAYKFINIVVKECYRQGKNGFWLFPRIQPRRHPRPSHKYLIYQGYKNPKETREYQYIINQTKEKITIMLRRMIFFFHKIQNAWYKI